MYQLLHTLSVQQFLGNQVPALFVSLCIAEFFYKFHSFTLECAAFLATWFVVDFIIQKAIASLWPRLQDKT
jgi:hypothetical protein